MVAVTTNIEACNLEFDDFLPIQLLLGVALRSDVVHVVDSTRGELVEQRVNEAGWVEGEDVFHLFTYADVEHWQAEFAGDGDDDAAFGGAVQLGEDDAGDVGGFGEEAGLLEAVLAGGGVHDEEGLVRGAGD